LRPFVGAFFRGRVAVVLSVTPWRDHVWNRNA